MLDKRRRPREEFFFEKEVRRGEAYGYDSGMETGSL
jgi:hypothetical protein